MRRPVRRPARRPMAGTGTKKPSSFAAGKIKPAVKKAVRPGAGTAASKVGMTKGPSRPMRPSRVRRRR